MTHRIRDIVLPQDEDAALSFILGLQEYEYAFEPDRRLDSAVAAEHFAVLNKRLAERGGRVFMAEDGGKAIGWAVLIVEDKPLFVTEEEREHGYIAELFVVEGARGLGVGRALIAACEDEARRRGLRQIMIGVLTKNRRTAELYARAGFAPYASELRKYL
jgi:GNAT superfamily N-acetyltransferase